MSTAALLLARARAQAGTLVTLVVLVAAIAAVLAGSVGYTRAATVATVRATLSEAPATAAGVQVQTRLAADHQVQDAAARDTIERLLGEVDVRRTLRTQPVTVEQDEEQLRLVLAELPADPTQLVLTGVAPGEREVLVPDDVAGRTGVTAGDELVVGGTPLTVSGTWQAADAQAREWFGDPLVSAGTDGQASGLVLTGAETLRAVDDAPFVRWTVYPRTNALTAADLPDLTAGLAALERVLGEDDAVAVRGLTTAGDLAGTVAQLRAATSTASAVGLVPVALLAIISVVALVQVVRLLGQARAGELEILVARGAAPRTVTVWAAVESAVVALLGGGLGAGAAALFVTRLDGGDAQLPIVLAVGAAAVAVAMLTGTAVAGLQARRAARRMVTDRSGRAQSAAALGSVVLTVAAAALASWQLLRHGTPLLTDDDGGTRADPLAVLSLGAVLAALAMLALALLGPATRALAAVQARGRGLAGVLSARQVSRRARAYAVPVVLVVLAAAATTTASAFAGATAVQREQVAALATGTDVRVSTPPAASSRSAQPQSPAAAPYAALDDVAGAGAVLRRGGTIGDLPVALTALDTTRLDRVVRVPQELGLDAAVAGLAPADEPGIALPAGAQTLELTVQAHLAPTPESIAAFEESLVGYLDFLLSQGLTEEEAEEVMAEEEARLDVAADVHTTLWVADTEGALSMIESRPATLGPPDAADGHTLSFALPTADEYRLVGLDLDLDRPEADVELSYEVQAVAADGQDLPLATQEWQPAGVSTDLDLPATGAIGVRGELRYDWQLPRSITLRLLPATPPAALPAVVTRHLATAGDLGVGDSTSIAVSGVPLDLTVSGVVDAVPGGLDEHAVLLDLAALGRNVLATQLNPLLPHEIWLTAADDDAASSIAATAGDLAGPGAGVELAGEDLTDSTAPVRDTFWIAAAGAVVLALTGVAAVVLAMARERRSEVMVLRALGLSPGGQVRSRVGELLGVGVLGAVLGALAGWAAALLLVPTLARAAATRTTPMTLGTHLDPVPALGLLGVLLAGLGAVAVVVGARVRSQALDAEYREEVR